MVVSVSQIESCLEERVEKNEKKLDYLSGQVRDLTTTVNSIKETLKELPSKIEKMLVSSQRPTERVSDMEAESSFRGPTITSDYTLVGSLNESGLESHSLREAVGSLTQEGNIEEYIDNFKALSALVPDQTEEQSLDMFIQGLQVNIKEWIRVLRPTTCEKAIEVVRHVATAIIAPGEHPSVKGKIPNFCTRALESGLNSCNDPSGSAHQSIGPNSHTTQEPRFNSLFGPLKPYKPAKLIVDPILTVNTCSTKQEEEDEEPDLKLDSSYILTTQTSNSESIIRTHHHDFRNKSSCPTKKIYRLIQFHKPTCKKKPPDIFRELATVNAENFDLNNTPHKFLCKSQCNHCYRSVDIVNYQSLKVTGTLLFLGSLNEGAWVTGQFSLGDLEVNRRTDQEMLLQLEAMKVFNEIKIEVVEQKLNIRLKGETKLFQGIVSCSVKKLPSSIEISTSVSISEVKSVSEVTTQGVVTFCNVQFEVALLLDAETGFTGVLENSNEFVSYKHDLLTCMEELEGSDRDELLKNDSGVRCIITYHGYFVLICIYGPQAACVDTEWIELKLSVYKILQKRRGNLIIKERRITFVGDLNIALSNECNTPPNFVNDELRSWFISSLVENGGLFFDVIRVKLPTRKEFYTRWSTSTDKDLKGTTTSYSWKRGKQIKLKGSSCSMLSQKHSIEEVQAHEQLDDILRRDKYSQGSLEVYVDKKMLNFELKKRKRPKKNQSSQLSLISFQNTSTVDFVEACEKTVPFYECRENKNIMLAIARQGGDLAFFEGVTASSLWSARAVNEFLGALHCSRSCILRRLITHILDRTILGIMTHVLTLEMGWMVLQTLGLRTSLYFKTAVLIENKLI